MTQSAIHQSGTMLLMATEDLSGLSVLVIEDDADLRALFSLWIDGMGATVREAQDGQEAVQEVRQSQPDVILCDLHMPGMDGAEFVKHLRMDLDLGHIPVIAVTGSLSDAAMMGTLETDFRGHLVKPVTRAAIAAQIVRALGR